MRRILVLLSGVLFVNSVFATEGELIIRKVGSSPITVTLTQIADGWLWNGITNTAYYSENLFTVFLEGTSTLENSVVCRFGNPKRGSNINCGTIPWTKVQFTVSGIFGAKQFTIDFTDEDWAENLEEYPNPDEDLYINSSSGAISFRYDNNHQIYTTTINSGSAYTIWELCHKIDAPYVADFQPVFLVKNRINTDNVGGMLHVNSNNYSSGSLEAYANTGTNYDVGTNQDRFLNYSGLGSIHKHNSWNDVTGDYVLSRNVLRSFSTRTQHAVFTSLSSATVKAQLLESGAVEEVELRDPWYVSDANNTQPNAYFPVTSASNYTPTGKYDLTTGGVFLGQVYDPLNPNNPYYSVRAPLTKDFTISGQTVPSVFASWSYSNATMQQVGSNPSGYDQKAVVFTNSNATVTANYKGHLYSNSSFATAGNNQRKIALSEFDDKYALCYESLNKIWACSKTYNGTTWSNEIEVSAGSPYATNSYPSVTEKNGYANIVWQSTVWYGTSGTCAICLRGYNAYTNTLGALTVLATFTITSYPFASTPVIDAYTLGVGGSSDHKLIAWTTPSGISVKAYSANQGGWTSTTTISGTNGYCTNPSVVCYNNDYYALCWSNNYYASINYIEPYIAGGLGFYNAAQVSPLYWGGNQHPTIALAGDGKIIVGWQSFNNVVEGQSVHTREKTVGGSWSGTISSFGTGAGASSNPVIGTYSEQSSYILGWEMDGDMYSVKGKENYWGSPSLVATYPNGGGGLSTSNFSSAEPLGVWKKPDNTISVTTTGFQKLSKEEKILSYRLNKHALIYLDSIPALAEKGYKGMIAFEIAGLSKQSVVAVNALTADKNGTKLHSEQFTVESANEALKLAGAYYAKGLVLPENAKLNEIDNLVTVSVRDVLSGEKVKEVWNVPFSRLANATTTDGEFRTMSIPLSELKGKNVYFEVALAGDVQPIFVDDYYIYGKEDSRLKKFFEEPLQLPTAYALYQNYPNPFNPSTTIRFDLVEPQHVTVKVYNSLGQQVKELVDGYYDAGSHNVVLNASSFSSGAYFYRLTAGKFTAVKSFSLVK